MSRTDHHLRHGYGTAKRNEEGCRYAGVVFYAGFRQAMRAVVMPKRKAIAEQVADMQESTALYLGADLRNVSECLDLLDDYSPREQEQDDEDEVIERGTDTLTHDLFETTHDPHLGASSSIRHLMVCGECMDMAEEFDATTAHLPRPTATGMTRWLTETDLEDLMDARAVLDEGTLTNPAANDSSWHVVTPYAYVSGGWGTAKAHDYDPTKCERYRVWELARMLGLPSIVVLTILRQHLGEFVLSASSTVVVPVARRLAEAVEHEADAWLPLLREQDFAHVKAATDPSEAHLATLRTLLSV